MTDHNTKTRRAWIRAQQRPDSTNTSLALLLAALALYFTTIGG